MRPRYFVIFAAMRTGSNLLERSLALYDGLRAEGELFNPHFIGRPGRFRHLGYDLAARRADPAGFLERVIGAGPGRPGFRLFDGHDAAMIERAAADPAAARIILSRDPLDSYLSLKIARATGQWMLTRPEKRRLARVRFDAAEYADHRARLAAHYAQLRARIRAAGMTAEEVRYEELGDPRVMNRLAAHAGSSERKRRIVAPILRQTPLSRADRVTNPEDLPPGREAAPTPDFGFDPLAAMIACRGLPLVLAPLPGVDVGAALAMLRRAGPEGMGFARGLAPAHLARRRGRGETVCALIGHPAARLRRAQRGRGESFAAFLARVEAALAGRAAAPVPPAWAPQSALLDLVAREAPVDFVFRCDRWAEDAPRLLARIGADPAAAGEGSPEEAAAISPEERALVRRVHAEDFARFGFDDRPALQNV